MLTPGKPTTREEWLAQRKIGGSDAPTIWGADPYKSPLELWGQKTGRLREGFDDELLDDATRDRLQFGHAVEEMLAKEYARRTGRKVRRPPGQYQSARFDWMTANVDFLVSCPQRGRGVVEVKSPDQWAASAWRDGPPTRHQIQLQHNLETASREWGSLVVWLGKGRLEWYDFDRHAAFVEALVDREESFWRCVQTDTPPPVGIASADADARGLELLYPTEAHEDEIELPGEALFWHEEMEDLRARIKGLRERQAELQNRIKAALGDHLAGVLPDGSGRYRWKSVERKGYTVEPKVYRDFRLVKSRGKR